MSQGYSTPGTEKGKETALGNSQDGEAWGLKGQQATTPITHHLPVPLHTPPEELTSSSRKLIKSGSKPHLCQLITNQVWLSDVLFHGSSTFMSINTADHAFLQESRGLNRTNRSNVRQHSACQRESPRKQPPLPCNPWRLSQQRIRLQCRRPGFDPQVGKIPRRRKWQPTPVFLPMTTHSNILAWAIPWTEEPGGLESMGQQESDTTEQLNHPFTHPQCQPS